MHCLETFSPMAYSSSPPPALKRQFALIALLCMATCCKSDADGIIDRALECFNDHYEYSGCQEAYRLHPEGTIHVPPEAVDEFCGGPCLSETKLVLKCIDGILYDFKFYNGASLKDVGYTLETGCGHGEKRGDFDTLENLGAEGEGFGDYFHGHGNKLATSTPLFIMLSGVLLLWV